MPEENIKESSSFHSGKRLGIARKLHSLNQKEIIGREDFPVIEERTLRRWEKEGIPCDRVKDVVSFFGVERWGFEDERLTEKDFRNLFLHPQSKEQIREKIMKKNEQEQEEPSKQQESSQNKLSVKIKNIKSDSDVDIANQKTVNEEISSEEQDNVLDIEIDTIESQGEVSIVNTIRKRK